MFGVLVRFRLREDGVAGAEAAMRAVAPLMRAVPGNLHFDIIAPDDAQEQRCFYELWTDRASWERHMADRPEAIAQHVRAIASAFAGPPEMETFSVVEG
jgi:quinol monooxygenase YgiN